MNRSRKFAATLLLTAFIAGVPMIAVAKPRQPQFPATSGTPGATFSELTESMKLIARKTKGLRVATSALRGSAALGTPFCPTEVVTNALAPSPVPANYRCSLVAIGSDSISTTGPRTGLGTFEASIDVIIELPECTQNCADGPEFVIETVKVSGDIDFTPAFQGVPYGTIKGKVTSGARGFGQGKLFSGRFLLPFDLVQDPNNPNPSPPYFWLQFNNADIIGVQQIQPGELSLTLPLVRFDLWFE